MRKYLFKVLFKTGILEEVYAFNSREAEILAQADQIRKGNDYAIDTVEMWLDGKKFA